MLVYEKREGIRIMNVNSGGIAELSVPIFWDGLFLFYSSLFKCFKRKDGLRESRKPLPTQTMANLAMNRETSVTHNI